MNWDSPEQRAALIERVGTAEYNRLINEHIKQSTIQTVNGHAIRPVNSRFGRLFMVDGTNSAFQTLEEAVAYAQTYESVQNHKI